MARHSSRIADVAEFLAHPTGTTKEKLRIGGKLFAAALILSNDWPPAVAAKAAKLKASLYQGQTVEKAVDEMSDTVARARLRQFTEDMVTLASEIERARSKSRRGRK